MGRRVVKRNLDFIADQMNLKGETNSERLAELNQRGVDSELVAKWLSSARLDPKSFGEYVGAADDMSSKAAANLDSVMQNGVVQKQGVMAQVASIHKGFVDFVAKIFNTKPWNENDAMRDYRLKNANDNGFAIASGDRTAVVGKQAELIIKGQLKAMEKTVKQETGLSPDELDRASKALIDTRGKDVIPYLNDLEARANEKLAAQPILKRLLDKISLAKKLYQSSAFRSFMDKQYENFDVTKEKMIDEGLLTKEQAKDNYVPNTIALHTDGDWLDRQLYKHLGWDMKKKNDFSSPFQKKSYDNGLEAELDGHIPASDSYTEQAGQYFKLVADKLRMNEMVRVAREDAESGSPKFLIHESSDSAKAAFAVPNEKGKVPDGYKDLSTVNKRWQGLYGREEVFNWLTNVYGPTPAQEGAVKTFLTNNNLWRATNLSGSAGYHFLSMNKKVGYLAGATVGTDGLPMIYSDGVVTPWSMRAKGRAANAGGADLAFVLEGMDHGFVNDNSYKMIENPIFKEQYTASGDLKTAVRISDWVKEKAELLNLGVFNWRTDMKTGVFIQLGKSKWFETMEKNVGRAKAMENLSDLVNLHLGDQNLEALGRTKRVRTAMQAFLLAPGWTEAKTTRLVGPIMARDPTVRATLAKSLAVQFGVALLGKFVMQSFYNSMNTKPADYGLTMQELKDGAKYRRLLMIRGEDVNGEWNGYQPFGSEEQDFATLSKSWDLAHSLIEAKQQDSQQPIWDATKGMGDEAANRMAPIPGNLYRGITRRSFAAGLPLPIGVPEIRAATQGKYGGKTDEDKALATARVAGLSIAGVPEHIYDTKAQEKADKAKKSAADKRERDANRKPVRVLE